LNPGKTPRKRLELSKQEREIREILSSGGVVGKNMVHRKEKKGKEYEDRNV